ncbi:MAG: Hypervirulence associated protein domain [Burkholderiales bacterium]|jgi:hypothetical protein|nr:Hypervirulence associated protein domain [Burkholderiales bacterium]
MQHFNTDDKVKWNSIHGTVTGKIVKEITKPTQVKGFTAKPGTEKEYLVKSEAGNEAIHKASALTLV